MAVEGSELISAREADVLGALGRRLTNAEIARELHISIRTVESHVSSLLRKLGAVDRRELARRAAPTTAAVVGAAPEPGAGRPVGTGRGVGGLPAERTSFVGRAVEQAQVAAALSAGRLVTLVGPGGMGKTRLAARVATSVSDAFPGGAAFVDLVPVGEAFLVQAVAAALDVPEQPGVPLEDTLHQRLRSTRTLLVLDNCEHVLDAVSRFVERLMETCPAAVVLATSRERLGLTEERLVPVPPLSTAPAADAGAVSDAGALFLDRARAGDPDFEADERALAAVCERLEGIPLAIELAAARVVSLGIDGLLAGLDDRLRLLTRSSRVEDRHRSVRAVIDWSHALLDDDERRLLRRLSGFAGGFDIDAVAAVATGGDVVAAADLVGRLTDKSLLTRRREPTGSQWRMLETVHEYARQQLVDHGELDDVRARHRDWARTVALELEERLDDGDAWRPRFDAVADDLRAAFAAGDGVPSTEAGVPEAAFAPGDGVPSAGAGVPEGPGEPDGARYELGLALGHLTYARRFLSESRRHYEAAARFAGDDRRAAVALRLAADVAYAEMRGSVAFGLLLAVAERAEAGGDGATAAIAVADAAQIADRMAAEFPERVPTERLQAMVEEARALAPRDDPVVEAHIAAAAAWSATPVLTFPDPTLAPLALEAARAVGDPRLVCGALDAVSVVAIAEGRYRDAARLVAERRGLLDRLSRHDPRHGGELADVLHMAIEVALGAGDLHGALEAARLADDDPIAQGVPHLVATHLLLPLALRGDFDEAMVQTAAMLEAWERAGRPHAGWMAPSVYGAALVCGLRGDAAGHRRWADLSAEITNRRNMQGFRPFAEMRIALHHGRVAEALAVARRYLPRRNGWGVFDGYAAAMGVEVAVVAGVDDAASRLADAAALVPQQDWAAACLLRAEARLTGDRGLLRRAVLAWEAVEARFERACTLCLDDATRAEGEDELSALGCPPPAV
jgi:predicted ATPase/DNA-binding CsgD family transcriptional regulator